MVEDRQLADEQKLPPRWGTKVQKTLPFRKIVPLLNDDDVHQLVMGRLISPVMAHVSVFLQKTCMGELSSRLRPFEDIAMAADNIFN